MTSLQTRIKQVPVEGGSFVVLTGATSNAGILAYTPNADPSVVGSFAPVAGTAATFADETPVALTLTTLGRISTTGAMLRDMGKTVISSGQLFRKVQYIRANNQDTAGVSGPEDSATMSGYYTFYVRLGINNGAPTGLPVARV